MAIRTLLVHLAPDPDWESRLAAAIWIAKRFDAHIVALFVASPVHLPAGAEGRGASALYLAEARENAQKMAREVEQKVRAACDGAGVSWEWAYGEADHLDELLEHVHHVDMTLINQVSFDHFEDRLMLQLPEKLLIGAGGPVVVLPKGRVHVNLDTVGTVLVAWTYSKEAIRALRDSLPVLEKAQSVKLFTCGDDPRNGSDSAQPVLDYLKRHGIDAERVSHSASGHAGEEILDTADLVHADLIVMGAYSHTSLLDKLFGTASRYVISHSTVPVLMSH